MTHVMSLVPTTFQPHFSDDSLRELLMNDESFLEKVRGDQDIEALLKRSEVRDRVVPRHIRDNRNSVSTAMVRGALCGLVRRLCNAVFLCSETRIREAV